MMKGNPVWKLLRRNISAAQIAGFAVANLVGLAIVMTALQFYRDVSPALSADSAVGSDYMVISRQVSPFGASDSSFSQADIDSLALQPWVADAGAFTSSDFSVNASVDFGGRSMSTALFFESVPDRFLDRIPAGWDYIPGSDMIPIILPKDYLSLYNFGFASSRGLPAVSEAMIGMIPLRISVSGNGRQAYFKGRVAGFTSRLNTIVVPQSFMDYAEAEFGEGADRRPSRLIVKIAGAGNPAVAEYLESHGLETGREADSSQMEFLLTVLASVVGGVGLVICSLALFILLLSLHLLLQKNGPKIHSLIMLGYTPGEISAFYGKIVLAVNLAVLVCASVVTEIVTPFWSGPLEALQVTASPLWPTVAAGALITVTVTAVNLLSIRRLTRSFS